MKPLIIYHKNCRDGFTAAWVAWDKFKDQAEFLPAQYGDAPPDVAGREVYILDFSYPRGVLEKMYAEAESLVVLDHHKTAEENLRGLPYAIFDLEKSGAGLAMDYFYPGVEHPFLVRYVEDRDLWRFELVRSKAINAVVATTPMEFRAWAHLALRMEKRLEDVVDEGEAILRYEDALVEKIAKTAAVVDDVAYFNSPILVSEVGAKLAETHCFAVGWCELPDGSRIFSLRSRNPDGADVGSIAEVLGGGGHKHAAGVRWEGGESAREMVRRLVGLHKSRAAIAKAKGGTE